MKTQMKAVWSILIMTTIWLTMNSSKINNQADEQAQLDLAVNKMLKTLEERESSIASTEEEVVDTYTFKEAFADARSEYGAGDVFLWNGDIYSTDYAEEEISVNKQPSNNENQWVLNSDDVDDYCKTNNRDECGVCDGDGPEVWYADRDGDGLGDGATMLLDCNNPSVSTK